MLSADRSASIRILKNSGCSNAIYTARQLVNYFIEGNCTASVCALDISKAFDKVNHHALFVKLIERKVPTIFLALLINWLPFCQTCIKWDGLLSDFFRLDVGVRQGSILAPFFSQYVSMTLLNFV